MFDATGFITAGGVSSRMGSDKAWLEIEGEPLIKRTLKTLRPVTSSVAIIANTDVYDCLGVPVFADERHGVGPLEAVRVALSKSQTRRVLLVGCDLPFVTSELFRFLLSIPATSAAVVPLSDDNQIEPLCAIYSKEALPAVLDLIDSGERKMARLFERVPTRFVASEEMRGLKGAHLFFENINTLADYERALERLNTRKLRKDFKSRKRR